MLKNTTKYFNISGQSVVPIQEQETVVAEFAATNEGDKVYFNYNIINLQGYLSATSLVNTDFTDFQKRVMEKMVN